MRVELGRAAGDVDRVGARPVERGEAEVDRLAIHVLRHAIGPGVHVAMAAGHVAEPPHVDLEDLERRGPQLGPSARPEGRVEIAAGQRERLEEPELGRGGGERSAARPEAPGSLGARVQGREVGLGGSGFRGCHPAIPACRACSSIWTPCTRDAPPRIAEATWTASVICSRSDPFSRQVFVYASMQYGHWTACATPSAISAFSRSVSAPSAKTALYQAKNFSARSGLPWAMVPNCPRCSDA